MAERTVALWCRAGTATGIGHAMRCLALAEALRAAGWQPWLVGDLAGVGLVQRAARAVGVPIRQLAESAVAHALADVVGDACAVVLDGYSVPDDVSRSLVRRGLAVAAIGDFPGQWRDVPLVVNQNYGAERSDSAAPGQHLLAGIRYVMLRNSVVRRRPTRPRPVRRPARTALVVFGGTDPTGAGPLLTRLLLATREPLHVHLIAPRRELAEAAGKIQVRAGQQLTVHGPTDDLPALAATTEIVVGAAGSSAWEWACLGLPSATVCVADNQRAGYHASVADGLVAGLGTLDDIRADVHGATRALAALLNDADELARLSATGWRTVDGAGRNRVVAALEALAAGELTDV